MSTQVVARSAKEIFPKVLPPASPFSELLRRSKFATFDPEIRQTYSAPPSYTHRGNFGLKRPIANKKKHGYIVLKKFEEHAQYIEWDNAKEQVRWLQRVEELNLTPHLVSPTPWSTGLGPIASSRESGLDSEFCPGERAYVPRAAREELVSNENSNLDSTEAPKHPPNFPSSDADEPLDPNNLPPTRGKGAYGAKSALPPAKGQETFLQPNIVGMPPRVFAQYIKKLRELRPEFLAFVRQELKNRWVHNKLAFIDPDILSDEELVADLGSDLLNQNFHIRFLGKRTESMYHAEPLPEILSKGERHKLQREATATANEPQPIQPQPHKFGGMMYANPTQLESYFFGKSESGLHLQTTSNWRYDQQQSLASFAGMTARVAETRAAGKPVFETEVGANPANLPFSETKMRATTLNLIHPPSVVGKTASSHPISEVGVGATVIPASSVDNNWRTNPHQPGTFEYSALKPAKLSTFVPSSAFRNMLGSRNKYGDGGQMYRPGAFKEKSQLGAFASQQSQDNNTSLQLLSVLKRMANKNKPPANDGESGGNSS
ncbi:hypothetical protein CPB83DRAFT_846491 [Crepidotus variabilis]|uniref:Uncharacterized protein n=1 Tax=Crepidotus variabilis TaxID=179855 RepID=A0A9P6EPT3_9AGAR|nr:hypothetical protein CPB83DRAFT_846491 [Crepidotus variabilis]